MLRYRSDESLLNDHHEQGHTSHRDPEESFHATFWETAGWAPEDGYHAWREEGYSIPPHLKGEGRARMYGPNEGGAIPEEQDSPGWGSPQPGSPGNACPASFIVHGHGLTCSRIP